jgi:DNA-binding IclR family transcriptional regulator
LVELARAADAGRSHLAEAARLPLLMLRDATGESSQLYVRQGDQRVCLLSLESPHSLRTIVPVGAALPMSLGSAAKVLRGEPETLRRGWAQSVEEREKGVASVSAPVIVDGTVVAAVSVSGPIERTSRQPGRRYASAVVDAARAVERTLRYTWDGSERQAPA